MRSRCGGYNDAVAKSYRDTRYEQTLRALAGDPEPEPDPEPRQRPRRAGRPAVDESTKEIATALAMIILGHRRG